MPTLDFTDTVKYLRQVEEAGRVCKQMADDRIKHTYFAIPGNNQRPKYESINTLLNSSKQSFATQATLLSIQHILSSQRRRKFEQTHSDQQDTLQHIKRSLDVINTQDLDASNRHNHVTNIVSEYLRLRDESKKHPEVILCGTTYVRIPKHYIASKEDVDVVVKKPVKTKVKVSTTKKGVISTGKKSTTDFPFATVEECKSRATSQPFFMSVKDLREMIKNDPKLIAKVGSKFNTMTKEDICEKLFV